MKPGAHAEEGNALVVAKTGVAWQAPLLLLVATP